MNATAGRSGGSSARRRRLRRAAFGRRVAAHLRLPDALGRLLVVSQAQEHGLAQHAVRRALLELHLHDGAVREPDRAARELRRGRRLRGRLAGEQRLEHGEVARREAAAGAARVGQHAVAVLREQQRAEALAALLRRQVADDDEVVRLRGVDLDPVGRTLADVRRRGALADDALEPHALGFVEHRFALALEVLRVAQRAGHRQQRAQRGLALDERQRAQVEVLEREQIERVDAGRQLERRARDVGAARQSPALLQQREARQAARVEHDDLGVDDELRERQRRDDLGDLRKRRGEVVAGARVELDLAGTFLGEQAVAVVLELEHPLRVRERLARRREHRPQVARLELAPRGAELAQLGRDGRAARIAARDLLDGPSREHGVVRVILRALRRRVRVALLDQQPLVLAALRLDERPPAAQLVAAQLEQQLALVEPGGNVVQRNPLTAVPDDDGAGAVVVGRDHALEVHVVDGVVLDVHRQPLVGRIRRRPLRHGPGLQHAVELEPKVVVSPARGVLLHDEPLAARQGCAERLRGSIRLSLCAITL